MAPPIFDNEALVREMATVWRLVVHLCPSDLAESVVQDVYVHAMQTAQIPPELQHSPRLWLFKIACSLLTAQESAPHPLTKRPATRNAWLGESMDEQLQTAVCALPMPLRMVFLLSAVEQVRYEEIAAILGIPVDTVVPLLDEAHRCLQRPDEPPASSGVDAP